MKIGILSCNAHTRVLNFASPLHSYVFQKFLEDHGIDALIIDYVPKYFGEFDVRHPLLYYLDHPDPKEEKQKDMIYRWSKFFYERESRYERIEHFIRTHYRTTDEVWTPERMEEEDPGFDCYMAVTDVVWTLHKKTGFEPVYMLSAKCMEGKKKVAISCSRGASKYRNPRDIEFFGYLSDMDVVSVREKSFADYINGYTDLNVPVLLDPVFLQPASFYDDLMKEPEKTYPEGFVLLYFAMNKSDDLLNMAQGYAQKKGLTLVELSDFPQDRDLPEGTRHDVLYDLGIEEWLWYMKHASFTFTNSFHCVCFSSIFHTQFVAGARPGDKVPNILERLGLMERRLLGSDPQDALALEDIDYDLVDERMKGQIKETEDFVLDTIHRLENEPHRPCMSQEDLKKTYEKLDEQHRIEQEIAAKKAAEKEAERRRREEEKAAKEAARKAAEEARQREYMRFKNRSRRAVIKGVKYLLHYKDPI